VGGNIAFFCYILKAIGNADEINKSEKEKTMQRICKTLFFMTALLPFGVMAKVSVTNPTIIATQQAGEPSAIFMELHNSDNQAVNLAMVHSSQPANLVLHGTQNGKMILTVKDDGMIRVNMGEPIWEPSKIPFIANKFEKNYILRTNVQTVLCGAVSMGNPHCVVQVNDIKTANVEQLGPLLESHERFPERVNVGFMQVINRNHIKLRVYERGAGETQACGSGACAAAAVGIMQGALDNKVQVDLPGGSLIIEWRGEGHPLYMTGDATHVYDGTIKL